MQQKNYIKIIALICLTIQSSCQAMHVWHSAKEWWDSSNTTVKALTIGGVAISYIVWNEWQLRNLKKETTKIKQELEETQLVAGSLASGIFGLSWHDILKQIKDDQLGNKDYRHIHFKGDWGNGDVYPKTYALLNEKMQTRIGDRLFLHVNSPGDALKDRIRYMEQTFFGSDYTYREEILENTEQLECFYHQRRQLLRNVLQQIDVVVKDSDEEKEN